MAKRISQRKLRAWVAAVDMGYGHQRAAFPFLDIAEGGSVLAANNYPGIPASDRRIWDQSRKLYEALSRIKRTPVLGDFLFSIFDRFQDIRDFYPKFQDASDPSLQVRASFRLMEQRKWGKHFIARLSKHPLPLLSTFFTPAFMAEHWGYKGPIYLVVTDSDIARVWAPLHPETTRITYCVPSSRAKNRLVQYGVPAENIVETGFPLPEELLGKGYAAAKKDIKRRVALLDPKRTYQKRYRPLIKEYIGAMPSSVPRTPLTITFAIGGAGAQTEVAKEILRALAPVAQEKKWCLCFIAGVHHEAADELAAFAKGLGLRKEMGKSIVIAKSKPGKEYFRTFNQMMRQTDILWTKPSELVFYAALGIPLILAPPIGAQEVQNRKWIRHIGAAVDQMDPKHAAEWLPDLVRDGTFAEAAMQGFVEMPKDGTKNIVQLLKSASKEREGLGKKKHYLTT